MTFEEFLLKKKIDPAQLQLAESALFSEFNSHFNQMGEKSFDHSKKFWFNKLRRLYHLKEEPKAPKEANGINRLASQAEPLISPTIQATGYTPRFKPMIAPPVIESLNPAIDTEDENIQEKPVYKSRFKASIIPEQKLLQQDQKSEALPDEQPKPAYKPKFTPRMIKPK